MTVITLAEAKAHLNITGTANDSELSDFITRAIATAENVCDRAITPATVTEVYDGRNFHSFRLRSAGAESITTVSELGRTLTQGTDYRLSPGGVNLARIHNSYPARWPAQMESVTVTYESGYTTVPADLKLGILELLRHLWATQRGASARGRAVAGDDGMSSGSSYAIPYRVMDLLRPFIIQTAD